MFLLVYLFSTLTWANPANTDSFKDKFHVDIKGYWTDRKTNSKELECKAYGNLSAAGINVNLKSSADIVYALDCQADETGSKYDLLVLKKKKPITRLEAIATIGGDCGMKYESQSWAEDMNGDRMMDVIRRSKSKTVPSDCGAGAKAASNKDDIEAFFWDLESQDFKKTVLPDGDLKKLKKKYDFEMK